jgi:transposase-like protein
MMISHQKYGSIFPERSAYQMNCPRCDSDRVVKAGIRNTRKGAVQKYMCRSCSGHFSDTKQPYSQYPIKVILHAVELHNMGYPVSSVRTEIGKRYPYSPPIRTIYSWLKRYEETLNFEKIRKKYDIQPEEVIRGKEFDHQQVFPFRYHQLKLNIHNRRFPGIRRYIGWVERSLPDKMFLSGPRASSTRVKSKLTPRKREDPVTELCRLSLMRMSNRRSAHDSIENFFLINDDRTVCTELPVFINPKEARDLSIRKPLTGHVDIIQVFKGGVRILDYKPNLNHPENHTSQLSLYRRCLTRRTSIPEREISIGVFNEHDFYEFF